MKRLHCAFTTSSCGGLQLVLAMPGLWGPPRAEKTAPPSEDQRHLKVLVPSWDHQCFWTSRHDDVHGPWLPPATNTPTPLFAGRNPFESIHFPWKITALLRLIPTMDISKQPRWHRPCCVSVGWGLLDFLSASSPPPSSSSSASLSPPLLRPAPGLCANSSMALCIAKLTPHNSQYQVQAVRTILDHTKRPA